MLSESERLESLIKHLKTNAYQFSLKAGIAQGAVSNIINGRRRLSRDIIDLIVQSFPKVSLDWLLRGIGTVFLPEDHEQTEVVMEETSDYVVKNSPVYVIPIFEEDDLKQYVAANLRTIAKVWNLTQTEMIDALGANVGRQAISTYYKGEILPKLAMLLRLEQLSGWPVYVLATRRLKEEEIPEKPISGAYPGFMLTASQAMEITNELHRMQLRIGRIIKKIDENNDGK